MAKIKVYRCGHSGLYFPGDYAEKWGMFYGRGLGPTPVSECLNTQGGDFDPQRVSMNKHLAPTSEWMLPVGETYAPVEMLMVPEEELESAQEQFSIKQIFRQVAPGQYELVDEKKVAIGPEHPEFERGNRMICRYDDPEHRRIRNVIREKQKKSPDWAKLQALIGGYTYGAPERKAWA